MDSLILRDAHAILDRAIGYGADVESYPPDPHYLLHANARVRSVLVPCGYTYVGPFDYQSRVRDLYRAPDTLPSVVQLARELGWHASTIVVSMPDMREHNDREGFSVLDSDTLVHLTDDSLAQLYRAAVHRAQSDLVWE